MEKDIEKNRVAGFVTLLVKPIRIQALDAALAAAAAVASKTKIESTRLSQEIHGFRPHPVSAGDMLRILVNGMTALLLADHHPPTS